MQITSRQEYHRAVAADTDAVVAHLPLAENTSLDQLWIRQECIAGDLPVDQALYYGVGGYVVPVADPDAAVSVDTLWDRRVPKDTALNAAGSLDLDTFTADTTPEFEIGHANPLGLFGTEYGIQEFFRRRKRISAGLGVPGFKDATPDTFLPLDNWSAHVVPGIRVDRPSMALVGFSSPVLDITEAPSSLVPLESEWSMLQFVEIFLYDMWKNTINVVEAGAESPYDVVAVFLAQLLEDTIQEQTAGAFANQTWTTFTSVTWQMTVNGEVENISLTSEA